MDSTNFHILRENTQQYPPLNLFTQEGVYPNIYMSSFKVFEETKLPPPSAFFNDLTEEVTEQDYSHAQHVWKICKIQNLEECHDFYVKLDVLLLADVFQNFRNLCLRCCQIDPSHVYTLVSQGYRGKPA